MPRPEKYLYKGETRPLTAIVCMSMGINLISEAAMLKTFADSGLEYDILLGTGFGAIAVAFMQAGQTKELLQAVSSFKNKNLFSNKWWQLLTKKQCVLTAEPLMKWVDDTLDKEAIRRNPKQCAVNLFNKEFGKVESYELNRMSDSDITSILFNSLAMPFLFESWDSFSSSLLSDNFSVYDKLGQKMDRVLFMVPNRDQLKSLPRRNIWETYLGFLYESVVNQQWQQLRTFIVTYPGNEYRIIETPSTSEIGLFDFDKQSEQDRTAIINQAYESCTKDLLTLWGCSDSWKQQVTEGELVNAFA